MKNTGIHYTIMVLVLVASMGILSATTQIIGTVYNSDFSAVISGVDVVAYCDSAKIPTQSQADGTYGVQFEDGACRKSLKVEGTMGTLTGGDTGILRTCTPADNCTEYFSVVNFGLRESPVVQGSSGGGGGGSSCSTKWTCTEWSGCSSEGTQTRICSYPARSCRPTIAKPKESQSCTYTLLTGTNSTEDAPSEQLVNQNQTSGNPSGITGAAIGTLTSPLGIGIIVAGIIIVGGTILLIRRRKTL